MRADYVKRRIKLGQPVNRTKPNIPSQTVQTCLQRLLHVHVTWNACISMEIVHDIVQKIVFACFIINSENKYTYPWSIWLIFKYNINHHELILETLCRDYIFNIGSVYTFKSYKYLNSFNDSNSSSSKPVKMAFILSFTNTTTFSIIVFR